MLTQTQTAALGAYQRALETGQGLEAAAADLAACLRSFEKPRKPKVSAMDALRAPVKIGRKAKHWGEFVIAWEDGTQTLVRGVIYDRPADRWAAAFQAADRLRRLRARHGWEGEAGAPGRWWRPMGVRVETPLWWAYVAARPMPGLLSILADDGETYSVEG